MNKIKDKTLLLLSTLGTVAFVFMNLIEHKLNRIGQGIKYSSFEFFGILGISLLLLWITLIGLSFYKKKNKNLIVFIFISILSILLFYLLQLKTGEYTQDSSAARISLSSGFYLQIFCIYMLFSTYTQKIKEFKYVKWIGFLSIFGILFYFMYSGAFDDLSLIKEYNIKKTQFSENLRIHGILILASVVTGGIIAIPLGFLAYSKKSLEGKIMLPLSIIETIPSLSLFGVLLVPLSRLGDLAFFDTIGVSGIGWAPAYIALTLYTLLPIGRNTLTGFYSVEKNVIEAAREMLKYFQFAWDVQQKFIAPLRQRKVYPGLFWGTFDLSCIIVYNKYEAFPDDSKIIERAAFDEHMIEFGFWLGDDNFKHPTFFVLPYPFVEKVELEVDDSFPEGSYFSSKMAECLYELKDGISQTEADKVTRFMEASFKKSMEHLKWEKHGLLFQRVENEGKSKLN